jgi:hypothetical protein
MLSTLKKNWSQYSYGSYPTEFEAQPKILKKSSKHQINQSERKFFQKNYVSYLKRVKKSEIRMGATRRILQVQPLEHQIYQPKRKFSKRVCLVPKKCKGAKNSYEASQRNLQVQPKILKKSSKL